MSDKSAEYARETLNALIAGGAFPQPILRLGGEAPVLDVDALRAVETQLRDYYSTGSYEPKPSKGGMRRIDGLA